ncbi:AraC family transcriptional regulator [Iodobacter fluviatilis]|uniref:AraC family transcriptional regulator n=1 Tax=Iodobacter fluviatilis TaxID=537 RepID=A0A377SYJ3_9NEIS|nr:AraC family transcriptional regulator [Iodobacter fluviatilis]TCU81385.1 AraC family transcriptional regulator [Iodobacter fluviatilis]STR46053.1 DNA-binding transcriptional regulator SoxS [Iodobacter fluviatilis]
MDYISQHLEQNPTLDEVAGSAALSRFHFHRIFKAVAGETLANFTRRLRLERAAGRLLSSPAIDITTLAMMYGFSSAQNFAKAFRQHFGTTPSDYRLQAQQKRKIGNARSVEDDYDRWVKTWGTGPEQFNLLQNVRIEQVAAFQVVYMRQLGCYGRERCEQAHRDLLSLLGQSDEFTPAGTLSLYWDDPEITEPTHCRTDVCIKLNGVIPAERRLAIQKVTAGRYAIFSFECNEASLPLSWEIAFRYLVTKGLACADLPCFERYDAATNTARDHYAFDIYIPLTSR